MSTIIWIKTKQILNQLIFGVEEDAKEATRQLTIFGKKWSDVKSDLKKTDASGITKIGVALDGVRIKSIAAQAGVAALNTLVSFGLSLAVSWAVSSISKWINKEKEAAEQAEKLRQEMEERRKQTVENIKAYEDETESINSLIGQYVKLISTTNDISSINDDLSKIQDQMIEKYGLEADAIDLVNGKLEENIQLLLEQEQQRNKEWLRENAEGIKDAEDFFKRENEFYSLLSFHGDDESLLNPNLARIEAQQYFQYLKEEFERLGISDFIQETWGATGIPSDLESFTYGFSLKNDLEPQKQLEVLNKVIAAYEEVDRKTQRGQEYFKLSNDNNYQNLISLRDEIEQYLNILNTASSEELKNAGLENILGNEADLNRYTSDISKLKQAIQTFNDTTKTPTQRYGAFLESEEIKTDIQDLIYLYPALKDQAEATMQSLGTTTSTVIANEETLFNSFVETLDKTHKEALSNIDKMESAMASAIKGEGLSHDSAWELLKLDTDGLLNPVIDSAGKYRFALEDIVLLKDKMIEKNKELIQQDLESAQAEMKQAQDELKIVNQMIRNQASGNSRPNEDLVEQQYRLSKSIEAFGNEIKRDTLLIKEYDSHLGNLANTEKMLQAQVDALKKSQEQLKNEINDLNSQADKMLKAQEMKIDSIVDGLEAEEQILENDKALLQEQLNILEEQKEELENIIEQYKSVADIVGNTISDQIDEIKNNQQAVEDYYNELIDKLKSENKERADALDYAEKLAALENAKNNKVRIYGNGTGWTYMVDQDALAKAQRALEESDEDKAIQELEAQRDAEVKAFDVQISAFEEYADEWKAIVDSIQAEDDERLAQEILGSDWREKISIKDIKILQSFKTEYRSYNSQLTILTNNEIKNLEASIAAKDKEIDAKKKQIQVWKDYKSEVENTVNTIKNSLENYEDLLNQIVLDENSTYEDRQRNLNNFANKYSDIISQISRKNSELDTATSRIENLNNQITQLNNNPIQIEADVSSAANKMAEFIEKYRDAVEAMRKRLDESVTGFGDVNSAWDDQLAQAANAMRRMESYSQGGSVAYTGLAQVHGSPTKSETVFNAAQSRDLWNMVRSGQFSNLVAEKAIQGINFDLKKLSPNSNTSNRTVNIGQMIIKTDNPRQFHSQFMTEMKQYWNVQLSESPIN